MQSELVRLRLSTGKVSQRIKGFGHKAHGLVLWQHQLLVLDSANCSLVLVNPAKKTMSHLWQVIRLRLCCYRPMGMLLEGRTNLS